MNNETLYSIDDATVESFDIEVPEWIEQDVTPYDVAAIVEGGCASGAYMPAVTYHKAAATMAEHGDDVLQFIEDHSGELPAVPPGESWTGIAVFYLSCAVKAWAHGVRDELETAIEDANEDGDE